MASGITVLNSSDESQPLFPCWAITAGAAQCENNCSLTRSLTVPESWLLFRKSLHHNCPPKKPIMQRNRSNGHERSMAAVRKAKQHKTTLTAHVVGRHASKHHGPSAHRAEPTQRVTQAVGETTPIRPRPPFINYARQKLRPQSMQCTHACVERATQQNASGGRR